MGSNHRKRYVRTALYGGNLRLLWGLPFDSRGMSTFKGKNPSYDTWCGSYFGLKCSDILLCNNLHYSDQRVT